MLAALKPQFWWYLTRASGIVAWVLLALATVWGLLVASRMIPVRAAPKWLLDMHRFLGGIALAFVAVHMLALVADSYLAFSWAELFVPFASVYEPGAVAWGVVALYLLVAVEVTSLAMRHMPRSWWRAVHLSSFASFVMVTLHAFLAGTDARNVVSVMVGSMLIGVLVFTTVVRVLAARRGAREPRGARAPVPPVGQ